jgi:hypothetical protein
MIKNTPQFLVEAVLYNIPHIFTQGVHIQNVAQT